MNFALSGLAFLAVEPSEPFRLWGSLIIRLIAAAGFVAAAYAPRRPVQRPYGAGRFTAACALFTVSIVGAGLGFFAEQLPLPVDLGDPNISGAEPLIVGDSLVAMPQIEIAILFLLATVGFSRRAEEVDDDLLRWIGAGAMLGAFSALHYFVFPSLQTDWVSTGDLLRLGFTRCSSSVPPVRSTRTRQGRASAAALEERRRLARDLHDGLAQELAYVARHARRLAARERTCRAPDRRGGGRAGSGRVARARSRC